MSHTAGTHSFHNAYHLVRALSSKIPVSYQQPARCVVHSLSGASPQVSTGCPHQRIGGCLPMVVPGSNVAAVEGSIGRGNVASHSIENSSVSGDD